MDRGLRERLLDSCRKKYIAISEINIGYTWGRGEPSKDEIHVKKSQGFYLLFT
jgi:hypothetical protein